MKALVLKLNEDPVWADIDDMEAMKKVVDGEPEIIPVLIRDTVIIIDQDAKLKHKPLHFITENDFIAGDVIVAGMKGEEFLDISNDQAKAFFAVYFPKFYLTPAYKALFPDAETTGEK